MTLGHTQKKQFSLGQFAVCYACLFIMILFFKNSETASAWVNRGLTLCVQKLIPSLFPFMVISSLVVSSDTCTSLISTLAKPLRLLLGISREGACAIALGWLCGFPIGAKCASKLYDDNRISFREYELLCCVCSIPSPAFLVVSVGEYMLGDRALGAAVYLICLFSSLLLGLFISRRAKECESSFLSVCTTKKRAIGLDSVAVAISDSAVGMLSICGFVVFFSAFLGVLERSVSFLSLSGTSRTLMFCCFELTSGLSTIASLNSTHTLALCALAAGWSGLCVHFQTFAVCSKEGLHPCRFVSFFAIRAVLCFALGFIAELLIYG